MKVSCIPICFFRQILNKEMLLVEWLDMAADVGLDGVEMYDRFLDSFDSDYLERVAGQVDERGMETSMFTGYGDLARTEAAGSDSANPRSDAIEEIKRNVDAALILRTSIVRVVAGTWPENVEPDAVLTKVAQGLCDCLAYAKDKGIWLAFENHPQVGTSNADFLEILRRVDSVDLKINLDTSNPMVSGNNAVDLVRHVSNRVVHLHASDRRADLEHTAVGEGVVDFPAIFKILKEAGFDGWISMEVGGTGSRQSIADSLAYVKEKWSEA